MFTNRTKKTYMRAKLVSMVEREVKGLPVLMTEFGYKTFSMVVKSLGCFTKKTSPTYFRTSGVMETVFGQPQVTHDYPSPSTKYIVSLYKKSISSGFNTVIVSPGLEMACYLGQVLNAPVLPSQFIASAPNLRFVESKANMNNLYIVGHETDWPNLCIWVKPLNLGELYTELIDQAQNVLILTTNSGDYNKHGTQRAFVRKNISVSGVDGSSHYWNILEKPEERGYQSPGDKIPHWEFSMENEQILHLQKYCNARGIRTGVIRTGDWSCFIPARAYYRLYSKNNLLPSGIAFHTYWSCHPFYESEFLRIPIYNFQYGADTFLNGFVNWLSQLPFQSREGEYLTLPEEFNKVETLDPIARFESWGFNTVYRTYRPYDVWQHGWDDYDDLVNPTREWIVPRLIKRGAYRNFKKFLTFDEIISICRSVPKTSITVNDI